MEGKNHPLSISHEARKKDHLNLALLPDVQFQEITSGLEKYAFIHDALPEISLNDIDLVISFLGKKLKAPLIISAMVGGIETAFKINRNLAEAAQHLGLAMGVGSQRCMIEKPELTATFKVRSVAPDILLFANLGAVQLNHGFGVAECRRAVEAIDADALVLHLNPLQEALQPGGNTDFTHLLGKIEKVCSQLNKPVIIKEVGSGISREVAENLVKAGVSAIDVAGAGGTCWSEIERRRVTDKLADKVAGVFSAWGIPTAESIILARSGAPHLPIIAGGGIRNGIDVAKAIALGADAAAIAAPLLKAAMNSEDDVEQTLIEIIKVLKITMFCVGSANIAQLRLSPNLKRLTREL